MKQEVESSNLPIVTDERGMTIIEVITGLLLFGMVTSILYSFLLMGMSMYGRVSVETQLRNQSDTLYSKVISELRDAVYVQAGDPGKEIVYVKRAPVDPDRTDTVPPEYVDSYRMVLEEVDGLSGISIYGPDGSGQARYELTSNFNIDLGTSTLSAENEGRMVGIHLLFKRADELQVPAAERADIAIKSKIPLFRME